MAKHSPYFKFYVSEYNDGDIQLCSFEAQGVFTNLCSLYWSKEGELLLSKTKRLNKFFKVREKIWKELIEERCIKIENDKISISFLDEQLSERDQTSKQNSKNVSKRYQKQRNDSTVVEIRSTEEKQFEYNKERENNKRIIKGKEEERESNAREERNFDWFEKQIDEIWADQLPTEKKLKLGRAKQEAFAHLSADRFRLARASPADCMKLLNTWISNMKPEKEIKNGIAKVIESHEKLNAIIEAKYGRKAN